ncbi:MAG: hypothetical protein AAF573_06090 [Bacteroidota bacterium]
MKNSLFVIVLFFSFSTSAQKHTETIRKEIQVNKNFYNKTFTVNNINGGITVEGYDGSTIQIEAIKTIEGKNTARLEEGKAKVALGIHEEDDEILIYNKTPCSDVKQQKGDDGNWYWKTWKNNCDWGSGIHFHFDFNIKIPKNINLVVSTVNDGEIKVSNVQGKVKANNINGGIVLDQISGATHAHTINGDVKITYTKNPTDDSKYYSLNGNINAYYQKGLSAQLAFESFNGDFFTNIEEVEMLPSVVEKKKNGKGVKYKLGGKSKMQVRNGKVLLDFETFNGNVYVKEL